MGERKVICWNQAIFERPNPSCDATLLRNLSSEGFTHLVTSPGKKESVRQVLDQSGLSGIFYDIVSGLEEYPPKGMMYRPAVSRAWMESDEAIKARIVVVGMQPTDIEGLVSIKLPSCGNLEAVRNAILLLERRGDGDIGKGFGRLYRNPNLIERLGTRFEQRYAKLSEGGSIMLNYHDREGFAFGEAPRRFPVVEFASL